MSNLAGCLPGPSKPRPRPTPAEPQEPAAKKQAVCPPCDVPAMECEGGSFIWRSCEAVVFEWAHTDPQELLNEDRCKDMEQKCASKEELLCTA